LDLVILKAKTYFDPRAAKGKREAASPSPSEPIRFISLVCGQYKQNAIVDLTNRMTDAELTHRHAEEKYQRLAMEYLQLSMYQKIVG
jgi:hypothetical protein